MHKRGVNAGEGTASGKNVGHHWSIFGRSVFCKPAGVANDGHAVADHTRHGERALQQSLAVKIQKGFICIGPHAGTLAPSEDKAHARTFDTWHMEKHKA